MCKNLHRREHDLCARLDKEKQNMWDVVGVHRGVQGSHICRRQSISVAAGREILSFKVWNVA